MSSSSYPPSFFKDRLFVFCFYFSSLLFVLFTKRTEKMKTVSRVCTFNWVPEDWTGIKHGWEEALGGSRHRSWYSSSPFTHSHKYTVIFSASVLGLHCFNVVYYSALRSNATNVSLDSLYCFWFVSCLFTTCWLVSAFSCRLVVICLLLCDMVLIVSNFVSLFLIGPLLYLTATDGSAALFRGRWLVTFWSQMLLIRWMPIAGWLIWFSTADFLHRSHAACWIYLFITWLLIGLSSC